MLLPIEIQIGGPCEFVAEVLEPAGRQFEALVLDVARIDELRFVTALPRQRHLEVLVLGVGLIGYSLNRFFYKWYFIVDNNFHIQFIFYTHKGNK